MQPEAEHRSGYVALAGKPNVGKSTFLNQVLGQPVAAVSSRPQTTRATQLGIATRAGAQLVFVDTPGLHLPLHRLGESLNLAARAAIDDADVVLAMFDGSEPPGDDDRLVADRLAGLAGGPARLAALNKVDRLGSDRQHRSLAYRSLLPDWEFWEISALRGDGCEELLRRLIGFLPEGPPFFPEDQITDAHERDIAADLIRAAAMDQLHDEVPHSLAVRVEDYQERGEVGARIRATVFVERESQKGIVIGKGGERLKAIGRQARLAIEAMSGRSCYLELTVRVLPDWRRDPKALRELGFRPAPDFGEPFPG